MQNSANRDNAGNVNPPGVGQASSFSFVLPKPSASSLPTSTPVGSNPFKKTTNPSSGLFGMDIGSTSGSGGFGAKAEAPSFPGLFGRTLTKTLGQAEPPNTGLGLAKKSEPSAAPVFGAGFRREGQTALAPNPFAALPGPSRRPEAPATASSEKVESPLPVTPPKPQMVRRVSAVDTSQLRSVVAYNIPEQSNNKLELTKHFQQFGNITRIYPNPKKENAIIHFDSHDGAAKAKKFGVKLNPNVELKIMWKQVTSPREKKAEPAKPARAAESAHSGRSLFAGVQQQPADGAEPTTRVTAAGKSSTASQIKLSDGVPMQVSVDELRSILGRSAHHVAERSTILDARDKYIRLKKESAVKGKVRTALKGTCMDMCPEKERYSRAEKRRLALYEVLAGHEKDHEVDHRLCVKEYSRSSADQAEPLAHELRPLPVLQMTMDYLIAKIVDRCDKPYENLADWFNFLWDRTRGIRKDVTQQNLCEPGSVDLVEKCARFHIHCTARLCELDIQAFDQKINDENLTKCMQTLKHMYYDLSIKDVYCESEKEFRAYDVLLHLNDGDILRDVLQLRAEVRDSPKVRSALQLVSALNSRNYVRFFKLAKANTDYLQCCLLQRYFNQIRSQALQIMVQAYGPTKRVQAEQFQLATLVDLLGFEDADEAALFCECHGVSVSNGAAFFDRSTFVELPERLPPKRRSIRLIESKRQCSVSRIIANGPVPDDPTVDHTPHNSFDANGLLFKGAWLAEDQEGESGVSSNAPAVLPVSTAAHPAATAIPLAAPAKVGASPQAVHAMATSLAHQLINAAADQMVVEVAQEVARQGRLERHAVRLCRGYLEEFVRNFISVEAKQTAEEFEAIRRQQLHKEEVERLRLQFSHRVLDETVDSVVKEQLAALGREAIDTALRARAEALDRLAALVLESVVHLFITDECHAVAGAEAAEAIAAREALVARVQRTIHHRRLVRWTRHWRLFAAAKIRDRKEKQAFPACPSHLSYAQQSARLRSAGEKTGKPLKRKSVVDQNTSVKRFNAIAGVQDSIRILKTSLKNAVFDLMSLLEVPLRRLLFNQKSHCWKLVVVGLNGNGKLGEILKGWLGVTKAQPTPNGWIYVETVSTERRLTVCVRFENGHHPSPNALRGANALLVVYDPQPDAAEHVRNLARTIHTAHEQLAVASIALKQHDALSERFSRILRPCRHLAFDFENPPADRCLRMGKLLVGLVESCRCPSAAPVGFSTLTLWDLANQFISAKILPSVYMDLKERQDRGVVHLPLNLLVEFFNAGVRHLMDNVVADPDLVDVQWPAPELVDDPDLKLPPVDWNSSAYVSGAKRLLERYLLLPDWPCDETDPASVRAALRDYCQSLALVGTDSATLLSRIDSILIKSGFSAHQPTASDSDQIFWTDIFEACVDHRFQGFLEPGVAVVVGYFTETFDGFQPNASWIQAFRWSSSVANATVSDSVNKEEELPEPQKAVRQALNQSLNNQVLELPDRIAALSNAFADLASQAAEENKRFEAALEYLVTPDRSVRQPMASRHPKTSPTIPLDLADRAEIVLNRSRRTDQLFETFLERALEQ